MTARSTDGDSKNGDSNNRDSTDNDLTDNDLKNTKTNWTTAAVAARTKAATKAAC